MGEVADSLLFIECAATENRETLRDVIHRDESADDGGRYLSDLSILTRFTPDIPVTERASRSMSQVEGGRTSHRFSLRAALGWPTRIRISRFWTARRWRFFSRLSLRKVRMSFTNSMKEQQVMRMRMMTTIKRRTSDHCIPSVHTRRGLLH